MNQISTQIENIEHLKVMPKTTVMVIVIGNNCHNAVESLKEQLYTNFEIYCIKDFPLQFIEGKLVISELANEKIIDKIKKNIESERKDYTYLLAGEDSLTPDAILEYVKCAEEQMQPDVIFANEAIQYSPDNRWLDYQIKPLFSNISIYQSFFIGKAVFWKSEFLKSILSECRKDSLDLLIKEAFLYALYRSGKIVQLFKVLLVKIRCHRDNTQEKTLIPLLQKNINKNTSWKQVIGRVSSYNLNGFELYPNDVSLLNQTGFIIIENDLNRILQLLSQVSISCKNNEILVAAQEKDMDEIQSWIVSNELKNAKVIKCNKSYAKMLEDMVKRLSSPYQIILNDWVQWLNRINLERLVNSLLKPEVMIAIPQVATEGDSPTFVYAGAGINNLSLNGSYFKGRSQKYQGEQDMAWTNYEASMLSPYCMAIKKEVWNFLLPLHQSVITAQHFANEISFICMKKKIICEYSAQSSVWVGQVVGDFYSKNVETGEIHIGSCGEKPHLSGNYWHVLSEYGSFIEKKHKEIPCLLRSYRTHLKEDFRAFGISNINEDGKKRVLVFTHELSLTGAPLVLVQAVKVLLETGYNILVVSPEDGPLRTTYVKMGVPVMVDPQLQEDFGYASMIYDFDFVIVSTVVLWKCIELLGQMEIPVFWWIHDSRIGYENYLRYVLPETIGNNILLYCGGDYAQKVITNYRPKYPTQILLYGIEDCLKTISNTIDRTYWELPMDKFVFANIGQVMKRKGQDILVKAIRLLPQEILEKSIFVFVGSIIDKSIYKEIEDVKKDFPQNVMYIPQMSYDLLKQFYFNIDSVVCSSIDDPLPAFIAEALMMSRICICSRNTAFNSLILPGINGYLFESGNEKELCEVICSIISGIKQQEIVKTNARKLYENTFSPGVFANNLLKVVEEKFS